MKNRAAIKAELMTKAETVIDELLDGHQASEEPKLSQVEQKVMELRQRLSDQLGGDVETTARLLLW